MSRTNDKPPSLDLTLGPENFTMSRTNDKPPSVNLSLALPGQEEQERGNSSLSERAPKRARPRTKSESTDASVLHDESQPRGPGQRSEDNVPSLDQEALTSRHQLCSSGSINAEQPVGSFGNNHLLPSTHVDQWHHAYPRRQPIPVSQQVQQGHMPPHFSPLTRTQAWFSPHPRYNHLGVPVISDPWNSWRAQAQRLYPPDTPHGYTTPHGYPSSHIPTFPNPSESLAQCSQKQQRPREDPSAENISLRTVISQLQSEIAKVKSQVVKLEAEVSSLKQGTGKDSSHAVKTPSITAELTDDSVLHDESWPRGPGPRLTMTKAQVRGAAAFVKKVISNFDQGESQVGDKKFEMQTCEAGLHSDISKYDESQPRGPGPRLKMTKAQARGAAAVAKKVISDVYQEESQVGDNMFEMRTCEAGLHPDIPKYDDESELLGNASCNFLLDSPTANVMEELLGSSVGAMNKCIEEQFTTVHEDRQKVPRL